MVNICGTCWQGDGIVSDESTNDAGTAEGSKQVIQARPQVCWGDLPNPDWCEDFPSTLKGTAQEAIDSAPIGDTIEVAESGEVIFYSNWYGADGDEHGVSFELIRRESSLVDIPGTIGFNGIMMNLPVGDTRLVSGAARRSVHCL